MAKGCKTGGRIAGTPNKVTQSVKSALERAFDQLGGVNALVKWARSNPTEFYRLWGKLLPKDLNVTEELTHKPQVIFYIPEKEPLPHQASK